MESPVINCPICKKVLTEKNVARWDIPNTAKHQKIRLDGSGKAWCEDCMDEHDSIDWDKVHGN